MRPTQTRVIIMKRFLTIFLLIVIVFSASNVYAESTLSEAMGYFSEAVNKIGEVSKSIQTINHGDPTYYTDKASNGNNSIADAKTSASHKKTLSSSNQSSNSISEQGNYNRDKQAYSSYDSMLSGHFYGGRSASRNEVKQWQKKMKEIRTKWESKGKNFPKSDNESRSTSGCSNSSHTH